MWLRARVLWHRRHGVLARLHSVPGSGLLRRLSPGPSWPAAALAKGDFIGDDQPLGISVCSACSVRANNWSTSVGQISCWFEQTFVTDGGAPCRHSMDVDGVQADVSQGRHPDFLSVQEDVHKEIFQFLQKGLAEIGNGVMIRMEATREEDGTASTRSCARPSSCCGVT